MHVGWVRAGATRTMTCTLAARVTSQAARLGSSTARATRGSSSTKCASRHPRDRPSMPTAPAERAHALSADQGLLPYGCLHGIGDYTLPIR